MKLVEIECDKCRERKESSGTVSIAELNNKHNQTDREESDKQEQTQDNQLIIDEQVENNTNGAANNKKLYLSKNDNNNNNNNSIVIAKCYDCNNNLCSNCLLEHQVIYFDLPKHKLSLLNETAQQLTDITNTIDLLKTNNEINNNNIQKSAETPNTEAINVNKENMNPQNGLNNVGAFDFSALLTQNFNLNTLCSTDDKQQQQQQQAQQPAQLQLNESDLNLAVMTALANALNQQQQQQNAIIKRRSDLNLQEITNGSTTNVNAEEQSNLKQQFVNPFQRSSLPTATQNTGYEKYMQKLQQFQYQQQMIINQHLKQSKMQSAQTQAQQVNQTNRLIKIENDIQKIYNCYLHSIKERKDYLLNELNTVIQYGLLQNTEEINTHLQMQYKLEIQKQQLEKEIETKLNEYKQMLHMNKSASFSTSETSPSSTATNESEEAKLNENDLDALYESLTASLKTLSEYNDLLTANNQLIINVKNNSPLASIEFVSNLSAITTSIRNTFGYIRVNQAHSAKHSTVNNYASAGLMNNHMNNMNNMNNCLNTELNVLCDFKPMGSGANAQQPSISSTSSSSINLFSNNSVKSNLSTSSALTNSTQNTNELISSPISIIKSNQQAQLNNHHHHHQQQQHQPLANASNAYLGLANGSLENNNNNNTNTNGLFAKSNWKSIWSNEMNNCENETIRLNPNEECADLNTSATNTAYASNVNGSANINSAYPAYGQTDSAYDQMNYMYGADEMDGETLEGDENNAQSNKLMSNNNRLTLSAGSTASNKSCISSTSSASSASSTTLNCNSTNASNALMLYQQQQQQQPHHHGLNQQLQGQQAHLGHNKLIQKTSASKLNTILNGGQEGQYNSEVAALTMNSISNIISLSSKQPVSYLRAKMIYHVKFGEFGVNDGQFTEPSGVTINTNNDIIVADTNSHRIQIFDKDGVFKFKFGECGKRDGQLLYPNRVSIVKQTGDIVVTERSPTHQIQIYNKYGQFVRKFGANILQHPRGVCVDYKGRIIVVECKVMRVIIFDLYGNVLQKFNCSKYLEFPNGVCCSNPNISNNYREEIYISDNRAHCIKVFDYNGNFIRQIGCEGLTNYPIGVGINSNNEILVADNHNNFNLTVFTQDGKLINALESKVKHAQCFDVGLMDDGSIVLASKDYRIYVYKYNASHNYINLNANNNTTAGMNSISNGSSYPTPSANSLSTINNLVPFFSSSTDAVSPSTTGASNIRQSSLMTINESSTGLNSLEYDLGNTNALINNSNLFSSLYTNGDCLQNAFNGLACNTNTSGSSSSASSSSASSSLCRPIDEDQNAKHLLDSYSNSNNILGNQDTLANNFNLLSSSNSNSNQLSSNDCNTLLNGMSVFDDMF